MQEPGNKQNWRQVNRHVSVSNTIRSGKEDGEAGPIQCPAFIKIPLSARDAL